MSSEDQSTTTSTYTDEGETEAISEKSSSTYLDTVYTSISDCPTIRTTYLPQSVATTDFEDSSCSNFGKPTGLDDSTTSDSKGFLKKKLGSGFMREFSRIILMDFVDEELSDSSEIDNCKYSSVNLENARMTATNSLHIDVICNNVTELIPFKELLNLPIDKCYLAELCFSENLIVSIDTDIKNKKKMLKENDLEIFPKKKNVISDVTERVGVLCLRIEEIDNHIMTYCNSQLSINNDSVAGTQITSIILNDFTHVEEKKTEWHFVDGKKVQKKLDITNENEKFVILMKHRDCCATKNRQGKFVLNSPGNFLQDGGIYVLMRFLIISKFIGNLEFWTVDINGKIGKCILDVSKLRAIFVETKGYKTIRIKKIHLRACSKPDISKTYFLQTGHIVQHKWKGCPYYLHLNDTLQIPPRFSYMSYDWMNDIILLSQYDDQKTRILTNIKTYLDGHTEMKYLLQDYLLYLKLLQPENIYNYTINFFTNLFCKKLDEAIV